MQERGIKRFFRPITWSVYSFLFVILFGSFLLSLPISLQKAQSISYIDALFISTSATCVTGLSTLDIGTVFSRFGQSVILLLIQIGGIGITVYTSFIFLLISNRIPFSGRMSVVQVLITQTVDIKKFLLSAIFFIFTLESIGAFCLYLENPVQFHGFSALFHAISAFCNAGFSLFPKNLETFAHNLPACVVIMLLIITGGLGISVLDETRHWIFSRPSKRVPLSRYAKMVYRTTFFLIAAGTLLIWFAEASNPATPESSELFLPSLFQAVTARTAGFNTLPIASMTGASLLFLMGLMSIGGASGSCAGGLKISTFRILCAYLHAELTGRPQAVVCERAVPRQELQQALALFFFFMVAALGSTLLLALSEGSFQAYNVSPIHLLDSLFEVISALATVGLSTGITDNLNDFSKLVLVFDMFIGRVGLFALLLTLQQLHGTRQHYRHAEASLPIG